MMKMSVKKIFFMSLFISFFSCFKFSAETFSFAASVGFQSGKVQEYVYDSGDVLSRLDWKTYFIPELFQTENQRKPQMKKFQH